MPQTTLPFTPAQIEGWSATHPTPFYLYDERGIRAEAQRLYAAFAWNDAFKEYFAVKATPTPAILQLLKEEGCGADCSSLAELILAERVGLSGEAVMFTSNNTPAEGFQHARALGAIINLDDVGHLDFLEAEAGLPELLSFRFNPGPLRSGNPIIGEPREAKFGVTRAQLFEGYGRARERGVKRFGLHAMVVSNERERAALLATAEMLFEIAVAVADELGIHLEWINLGGGIGIPYRPDEPAVPLEALGQDIRAAYERTIGARGLGPIKLLMECGRLLTGPHGYLVTRVRHLKETYKRYIGLDATMADLMRPGMYGAYHHITVLGKENEPATACYDVTGSLCENNDKFAVDRPLPQVEVGDLMVIHDAGAHGRAMGFNYNGTLRPAELLLQADGQLRLIRRRETLDDYFATLRFPGSSFPLLAGER